MIDIVMYEMQSGQWKDDNTETPLCVDINTVCTVDRVNGVPGTLVTIFLAFTGQCIDHESTTFAHFISNITNKTQCVSLE